MERRPLNWTLLYVRVQTANSGEVPVREPAERLATIARCESEQSVRSPTARAWTRACAGHAESHVRC